MGLAAGGPVVLALIFRVLDVFGLSALSVNGVRVSGAAMFGGMIWLLYRAWPVVR